LQLAHLVTKQDWEEKGLPRGLNLRIALHAGPDYEFDDPITGNRSYSGTHVSRAARESNPSLQQGKYMLAKHSLPLPPRRA
jgi:hypothetical protein